MLKNYIKIALRYLLKHRLYSFINIFGFSIALVPVILTFLYVSYEFSYDRYNENFESIYRVTEESKDPYDSFMRQSAIMPSPLSRALKDELPEIEYAARLRIFPDSVAFGIKKFLEKNILFTDSDFFKIFTIDMIEGSQEEALSDKYSAFISESIAQKYFGKANPIGKIIEVRNVYDLTVKGVFKDLPENSHFHADVITSASLISPGGLALTSGVNSAGSWGFSMFFTYVLVKPHTDIDNLSGKIKSIIQKYAGSDYGSSAKYALQPLSAIHLRSNFNSGARYFEHQELEKNCSIVTIYLYSALAFIILLIACINYVNLASARSAERTKEIGVRKIVGAQRKQLIKQLLTETIILTFFAFIVSIVLVELILPYFNSYVGRNIQFALLQNIEIISVIVLVIGVISLCAGIYPAIILSSLQPVSLFGGNGTINRKINTRNILVVVQFVLSLAFIFCAITIGKQLNYINKKDLGYTKDNIIVISLGAPYSHSPSAIEAFTNELMQNPNITNVSASAGLPNKESGDGLFNWPGRPENVRIDISHSVVDYNFIDLYGLKIIAGRKFLKKFSSDENDAVIINETAARTLGWKNPLGKQIAYYSPSGSNYRKIIGVVKDFNTGSLYNSISPFFFTIDENQNAYQLSVKIKEDKARETLNYLRQKMKSFEPGDSFNYKYFSDIVNSDYGPAHKLQTIFSLFSLFTIFIACLGLTGLISYMAETRRKEIGIRKVLGASPHEIVRLFLSGILKLVIVSCIAAVPVAYLVMQRWLSDFAYRTNISLWYFAFAGSGVIAVSLIVLIFQVLKASSINPVISLRQE